MKLPAHILADLPDDSIATLKEVTKTRSRLAIWGALVMVCGEYAGTAALVVHGDWFSAYLVVAYALRETRGGENYQALAIALLSAVRHRERRAALVAWIRGAQS